MRFPQAFIDEVRTHADIVQVIQDHVPLKQVGARFTGLCPFHSEKTPSFSVNRELGFFKCFGCGKGGDVFKFVELQENVSFGEAVRLLAERFGLALPVARDGPSDHAADAERESLLRVHELATTFFREQLASPLGTAAREHLRARDITSDTMALLGLGYAPSSRDTLKRWLLSKGMPLPLLIRSGLVMNRDDGSTVDRFRDRVIVPIARESGPVIAFGGRSLQKDRQPKYLNSPETPIYTKSRTLYGLQLSKTAIRKVGQAVLVEGYFDYAQAVQAGVTQVVATCGTALTRPQVQLLRRFTSKVVLSFDPDAAGQGAAVRSSDLLVTEGLHVTVASLPAGLDPDGFVRTEGGPAYRALIDHAQPYLDYLIERTAARYDVEDPEQRRQFLAEMLETAANIPDPATRDQFADRLSHRARITEEVVRSEIRRAAIARRKDVPSAAVKRDVELKAAERDLVAALMTDSARAVAAVAELESADLDGLGAQRILLLAQSLGDLPPDAIPGALLERLTSTDVELLTQCAARGTGPASAETPAECVRTLRRDRYARERAAVQAEIRRLEEQGAGWHDARIKVLWEQKQVLSHQIESLIS